MAMERFPVMGKHDLDADQRALWDELTLGPRGFYTGGEQAERLPDLYNAWLHFPDFGRAMMQLGDHLRSKSELNGRLRELVILVTSAEMGAMVEFDFHVPFAQNEGLPDDVIAAIAEKRRPDFDDPVDEIVHEANVQLLRTHVLTAEARQAMIGAIGYPGLMQFVAAVTLYAATAWTTNIARVKLADDFDADPEMLKDFFAGKPAQPKEA
jgi:4-carboxymuconolactone decarboxylase